MSTYTTELRTIMESKYEKEEHLGYSEIETFLNSKANSFMPNYPIWDENYRLILNKLILKHFWTREIGYETPGRFMLALDEELNRWMPYYNLKFLAVHDLNEYLQQYGLRDKITERDYDLHHNGVDDFVGSSKDTRTGTVDKSSDNSQSKNSVGSRETDRNDSTHTDNHTNNIGTNTDSSYTDRVEHQLYSDTPQGGIEGIEGTAGQTATVDGMYYLTNATKNYGNESSKDKSQNEQSSNGTTDFSDSESSKEKTKGQEEVVNHTNDHTSDNSENTGKRKEQREITDINNYIEHMKAYTDFPAKKLADLTEDLQDINSQIIRRLEPLFMQIWADESNLGNGWFGMAPDKYYY